MDKILGEVFDEYVDKQIKVRQKSLGKSQKSTDDLVVFNSSTPWIRLSSSVIVDEDRAKTLATNLGINQSEIVGNNLARNLVLFAGTSDGANLSNRKGGVGYGLESSYGFLSDKEQGYKPMPGVTGITANYKNNGTLKQAQVKLTCFTRKQFEAIEATYLRLGFTMLLEWGHSLYFDNGGKKKSMSSLEIPNILFVEKLPSPGLMKYLGSNNTGVKGVKLFEEETEDKQKAIALLYGATPEEFKKIISTPYSPERLRIAINDNKGKTGGNYDAMMAKVSNFSWTLNSDLSYSITLDLVSVGDIIDSLKMNFGGTNLTEDVWNNLEIDKGVRNLKSIQLDSGASAFNSFLAELVEVLNAPGIRNEFEPALQTKLDLADKADKQQELIQPIKDAYSAPIENGLLKLKPIQEARNLLLNNKVFKVKDAGNGNIRERTYGYTDKPGVIAQFNTLIAEHNKLVATDFPGLKISADTPDTISIKAINSLNLNVEDRTVDVTSPLDPFGVAKALGIISEGFVSGTVVEDEQSNSIYSRVIEIKENLEELKLFFGDKLRAKDLSIWINLIDYLEKRKADAGSVILRLLEDREFDKDGKLKLDDYQE